MTQTEAAKLVGQSISLEDNRTGYKYTVKIAESKIVFGHLKLTCEGGRWFNPKESELESVKP